MKKQTNAKILTVVMAIAVAFTISFNVKAQTAVKVFKVGDRVEMNVANDVQNEDRWIKGTVTEVLYTDDGRILSYKVKRDGEYVQQFGNLARVIRPLDDGGAANTTIKEEESQTQNEDVKIANPSEKLYVTKDKLIKVLQTKALTSSQIIEVISSNGVGFVLNAEVESELRNAGAEDDLIESVRDNYLGNANKNTPKTNRKQTNENETTGDSENSDANADCSFEKYSALGSAGKFSEALIKSALYERYSFETETGGLSSPLAVGETFLNIKLLGSYTNTVTVIPGRGAQRKHDGAPVGATIYRFHAKYIVCRKYKNATRRTQYESDNVCFKAKNGNWDCPVDSVPQITELK